MNSYRARSSSRSAYGSWIPLRSASAKISSGSSVPSMCRCSSATGNSSARVPRRRVPRSGGVAAGVRLVRRRFVEGVGRAVVSVPSGKDMPAAGSGADRVEPMQTEQHASELPFLALRTTPRTDLSGSAAPGRTTCATWTWTCPGTPSSRSPGFPAPASRPSPSAPSTPRPSAATSSPWRPTPAGSSSRGTTPRWRRSPGCLPPSRSNSGAARRARRSTVGTVTTLSNSLRMLFSRAGSYPDGAGAAGLGRVLAQHRGRRLPGVPRPGHRPHRQRILAGSGHLAEHPRRRHRRLARRLAGQEPARHPHPPGLRRRHAVAEAAQEGPRLDPLHRGTARGGGDAAARPRRQTVQGPLLERQELRAAHPGRLQERHHARARAALHGNRVRARAAAAAA